MKTLFLAFLLIATPAFAQYDEDLPQYIKETFKEIALDLYCMNLILQRSTIDDGLKIHMIHIIGSFMSQNNRFKGPFVIERIERTQDGLHFTEDGYVVSITVNDSRSYLLLIRDDKILASQSIPLINEGCGNEG